MFQLVNKSIYEWVSRTLQDLLKCCYLTYWNLPQPSIKEAKKNHSSTLVTVVPLAKNHSHKSYLDSLYCHVLYIMFWLQLNTILQLRADWCFIKFSIFCTVPPLIGPSPEDIDYMQAGLVMASYLTRTLWTQGSVHVLNCSMYMYALTIFSTCPAIFIDLWPRSSCSYASFRIVSHPHSS